jgi:hypothetical protein
MTRINVLSGPVDPVPTGTRRSHKFDLVVKNARRVEEAAAAAEERRAAIMTAWSSPEALAKRAADRLAAERLAIDAQAAKEARITAHRNAHLAAARIATETRATATRRPATLPEMIALGIVGPADYEVTGDFASEEAIHNESERLSSVIGRRAANEMWIQPVFGIDMLQSKLN